MDIQNKTVLVLGAWGLVGNAVTRKLISENPKKIIVTSLKEEEAVSYAETLREEFPNLPSDYFVPWWGNVFVRNDFKDNNKLIWTLVILFTNLVGVLLYLMYGTKQKISKKIA